MGERGKEREEREGKGFVKNSIGQDIIQAILVI
jgi:hypothetical protein